MPNNRTMGSIVLEDTTLLGQKLLCQKHDPPSRKKTLKDGLIFTQNFLKLNKNMERPCGQSKKILSLARLTARQILINNFSLRVKSKLFSSK